MDLSVLIIYFALFISLYFEIYLLLTFFEHRKEIKAKKNKKNIDFFPSTTIIVPCWNEEDTIEGTLKSLLNLDYPKDKLKIIVVDDGSTDSTADKVEKFLPHSQINFIQKENGGKHTAMNRALKEIDTVLVGSLDADSFVDKNALKFVAEHFKNKNISAVTSVIKSLDNKNIWAQIQKSEFLLSAKVRKIFALSGSIFITPGPFSIMRALVVKELGGWKKAHNTEDMEIGIRMQSHNYIIENEEMSIIYTKPLTTFKALYKQRLRWLYGFLRNTWDYRFMFFNKKYGNLGIFILPYSLMAVVSVVILFLLMIFKIYLSIIDWIIKISVVGFNFDWGWPNLKWFFIDTGPILWIIFVIIIITIAILIFSKKMVNEEKVYTKDIPIYLIIYGLIAPLWLLAAFWKALFKIESKWEDN